MDRGDEIRGVKILSAFLLCTVAFASVQMFLFKTGAASELFYKLLIVYLLSVLGLYVILY